MCSIKYNEEKKNDIIHNPEPNFNKNSEPKKETGNIAYVFFQFPNRTNWGASDK